MDHDKDALQKKSGHRGQLIRVLRQDNNTQGSGTGFDILLLKVRNGNGRRGRRMQVLLDILDKYRRETGGQSAVHRLATFDRADFSDAIEGSVAGPIEAVDKSGRRIRQPR